MTQTLINTLRFADRLKEAGFAAVQAEALARTLGDELTGQLPSKADFKTLEAKVGTLDASLTGRMDALESGLTGRVDALESRVDGRIDTLEANVNARIDTLEAKVDALDAGLTGRIDAVKSNVNGRIDTLAGVQRHWVDGRAGIPARRAHRHAGDQRHRPD